MVPLVETRKKIRSRKGESVTGKRAREEGDLAVAAVVGDEGRLEGSNGERMTAPRWWEADVATDRRERESCNGRGWREAEDCGDGGGGGGGLLRETGATTPGVEGYGDGGCGSGGGLLRWWMAA
ncbi:unnamed protein product [Linum trigynum]|uniref:Uncharacterized protein n=1 Tax=Linum trigynum TaxID=586398 RepID=A0AAV2ERT7_9ROSI